MQMVSKTTTRLIIWLMVLFLAVPFQLQAQNIMGPGNTGENYIYPQQRLDQLLAPVALYPDVLLSQILMASTYPLEVVEADRWLRQRLGLTGDQLDEALKEVPWDLSVKSLCHFPKVLDMMSMYLQFTTDLGNAFLNQKDQVMNTIQSLRARARVAGTLSSLNNERVVVQDPYISIEPVEPEVVYVPYYDPCLIYGPWWYPECSPLWFWWPDVVIGAGFFFGPPIFFGRLHGWCGFRWRHHDIFVHPNRAAFLGKVSITRLHGGVETWRHNPIHRRGVAYPGPATARRFGQAPRPGVEARRLFRGFPSPEGAPGQRGTPNRATPGQIERGERWERSMPPEVQRPDRREGLSRPPEVQMPSRPESRFQAAPRPSGGAGPMVQPQVRQPRMGSPFESFGHSGPEVRQHSERGFQSLQGGRPGGGGGMPRGGGFGGRSGPQGNRR
ncbi:MAG: DUF3300 domain-containing protein [Thermodesulfobacteriota bacterium]